MSKIKERKLFADRETRTTYTPCGSPEKARVDPTYAQDSQIKNMLLKFARGEVHPREPFYADVSEFGDFRQNQERILHLRNEFDKLPSAIRNLCGNDPANFPDVASDPKNREFLEQNGLKDMFKKEPDGSAGTSGAGVKGEQPPSSEPKGEAK